MANIGLYAKAVVGALSAGATAAITALGDGKIEFNEWLTIIGATVLALGAVWAVPNTPKAVQKYGKAIAGAIVAGIGALATAYVSGGSIRPADYVNVAIAVLGGLFATYVAPNSTRSDPVVVPAAAEDPVVRASEVESDDDVVEDEPADEGVEEDVPEDLENEDEHDLGSEEEDLSEDEAVTEEEK